MVDIDWHRAFDDPNPLPDGRVLKTLYDAGHYAAALPKAAQEQAAWQTAAEMPAKVAIKQCSRLARVIRVARC